MTRLDNEKITQVAQLSRLAISQSEVRSYTDELAVVFDHFEQLNELDTEKVEETCQVTGLADVYREDEVKESDPGTKDKLLALFPRRFGNFLKVKSVFNRNGFTLIELLVVIAIIGVLSTIVAVGARQAKASANDSRRMADINALQRAIELGYVDVRDYREVLGTGCSTAGSRVMNCDGNVNVALPAITNFKEHTGKSVGCTAITDECDYSVVEAPTVTAYRIGFWLEGGIAGLDEGPHHLTQDGIQ